MFTFTGDGSINDCLCNLFLVILDTSKPGVMKPLILWMLRLNFVVVRGKQISYIPLNSVQNTSKAASTSFKFNTFCQHVPLSNSLNRSILAALNFLFVISFCLSFWLREGNCWKLMKWSLISDIRVPQSPSPNFLLISIWSILPYEWIMHAWYARRP